jgi:hypothetical protein
LTDSLLPWARCPSRLPALFLFIGAILATTVCAPAAGAQWSRDGHPRPASAEWRVEAEGYFVDFRSRPGYLFGHTFIVYGRLDAGGRALDVRYAGIYPRDDELGLVIGTIIPVPASVRGVKGDFEESVTSVYRRRLTATEYARLRAAVRRATQSEHHWNLLTYNCNDFAVDIARALGLRTPSSMLLPAYFVAELRFLNGG